MDIFSPYQRCKECVDNLDQCNQCMLCLNCNDFSCGKNRHVPNYVVCQKLCNECEVKNINDKCTNCGNRLNATKGTQRLMSFHSHFVRDVGGVKLSFREKILVQNLAVFFLMNNIRVPQ